MISRSGVHALRAVVVLAGLRPGEYEGAAAIAKATDAPANYLAKLLYQMSKAGLLVSQKGMGGGFRLARDPSKVTLYDVVESTDDLRAWDSCIFGNPECSDDHPCGMHHRWGSVRDAYLSMLRTTTVRDLTNGATVTREPQGP